VSASARRAGGRSLLLRALVYGGLAVLLTWPLVLSPASVVPGGLRTDVFNSLWGYWFVADGLFEGHFPLRTTLLAWPDGGRLLVADPLNGALAAPLTLWRGPVLAYSVTVLVHLALAGLFADATGRALGGRGWVAGVAFMASPIVLSHLQNGSSEAAAVAWLPLATLAVARLVDPHVVGRALAPRIALAGLALAGAALGSGWYAGLGAFLFAGGFALGGHARRVAPAIGVGALLLLPFAVVYHQMAAASDGLVDIKTPEVLFRLRRTVGAADPLSFVMPGDFRSPDFARLEQNASDLVHTTYLGGMLVLLALWKGRSRALWLGVVASGVLALGPVLVSGGGALHWHGRAFPLPYALLEGLPGFASLSLLYRIATLVPLGLGLLADRAPGWLAPLVLVETLALSPARGLPALTTVERPAPLLALAVEEEGALISLPASFARTRLYEQTLHGHPLAASLNSGVTPAGLRVLAALRKVAKHELAWEEARAVARAEGVRFVVVHNDVAVEATFQTAARALRDHARKVSVDARMVVYAIE
jgi:hypothetical protein